MTGWRWWNREGGGVGWGRGGDLNVGFYGICNDFVFGTSL